MFQFLPKAKSFNQRARVNTANGLFHAKKMLAAAPAAAGPTSYYRHHYKAVPYQQNKFY
jgi:hypothetical protein